MLNHLLIDEVIKNALKEDIGNGDITTEAVVPEGTSIFGRFIAKEPGVVCGAEVMARVFHLINPEIKVDIFHNDGDEVQKGAVLAEISGDAKGILTGERVALNFFQRMSGVATAVRRYVREVSGTGAMITDTRKTTPGLRIFEKYAVRIGGGRNHRYNLSDGVLIKDNHIKAAGGIKAAVFAARERVPHTVKIEVETENLEMVKEAVDCGADIIMLDNMEIGEIKRAVELIGGRAMVEASGNMDSKNLKEIAKAGVDIISIGAITHSARALDISLKFV